MMERLELFLVRHAPSIHPKGVVPPHDPDADLSDHQAFAGVARCLPKEAPWWVSPLQRCQMTADTLLSHHPDKEPYLLDERLREQDYGTFHGRPVSDIWDEIKDGPKSNWHFLHPGFCPPGGESFVMLHERMALVMADIMASKAEQLVLIGHGMASKSLIAHAMGLSPEQALALAISPLSVTRMTCIKNGGSTDHGHGGQWQIDWLNRVF